MIGCNGCGKVAGQNETMYMTGNYKCICKECLEITKQQNKCKGCETTDESKIYVNVQGVGCYCNDCYNKSLNDSHSKFTMPYISGLVGDARSCLLCGRIEEKDKMISCEHEGKDAYICEICFLNDRAKVSRWKTDWNIGDTVYKDKKSKKGYHEGIIVAKHSDNIHYIVEYKGLEGGVTFKEDLSRECFSKDIHQWINDAFIDAGLDVMAQHQRTITKNDIDTLKKCLIHHMPDNG